jgi:hypothetical protein
MASIAQDEVRKLSERVKFGHKQSIQKGVVMGNSRIYGYDKLNGKLVINEKEAEMIRFVFEQYATGLYAIRAICNQLYDKGYRSRSGTKISHTTLSGLLTNPKYKGYYCGNKVKIADYRTKEQIFLPQEDWIMYKDETGETVPAIVSEELWDKVNEIFAKRSKEVKNKHRGNKTTSVLSGKLFCTHHNAPFWRTSYSHVLHRDKNIYQWICREKKRGKSSDCPTFAIYESELYDILSKCFSYSLKEFNNYTNDFIDIYRSTLNERSSKENVDKIIAEKNKLENQKDMLLDLYMSGDINKEDFKRRNDMLTTQLQKVQAEYNSLIGGQFSDFNIEKRLTEICNAVDNILNKDSQSLTKEEVDILVGMFVDHINVTSIDSKNMEINVIMNIGETKGTFNRSSGVIIQKMIPEQQLNVIRVFGREHINYNYIINLSIII